MNPELLDRPFGGEASFPSREGTLTAERRVIGQLVAPTGRIVCCDPFTPGAAVSFTRVVPAGRYPVEALLLTTPKSGPWVATVRVRFSEATIARWVPAALPGEPDDELHGYGVDSGTACFADAAAVGGLSTPDSPLRDALERALEDEAEDTMAVASVVADPGSGANVILFSSGGGDGTYGAWFGLDEKGAPAALMTDFLFLAAVGDPLLPENPADADDFASWLDDQHGEQREILDDVEALWLPKLLLLSREERALCAKALRTVITSRKLANRRDALLARLAPDA